MARHRVLLSGSLVLLCLAAAAPGMEWRSLPVSMRSQHSMAVDVAQHRAVLFGGATWQLNGAFFNDLYEFPLDTLDGYYWHQLRPAGTPPEPRCGASMVYDQSKQSMFLFGGSNDTSLGDLWQLDLTPGSESWTRLSPSGTGPCPRAGAYMVLDPDRNSLVVFGGIGYYEWYNDAWELDLDDMLWREVPVGADTPPGRMAGGCFYERPNERMVVFGGGDSTGYFFNDLWALDLTRGNEHWVRLNPTGDIPEKRDCFASDYDPATRRFYLFAGWNFRLGLVFNDLYCLDAASLTWTRLSPSGDSPIERRNPAGVFDPFNGNFVVFGGDLGGGYYLATTEYVDAGTAAVGEWRGTQLPSPVLIINPVVTGPVRIRYALPADGGINIRILDQAGRVVRDLFKGQARAAGGTLLWDRKDERGRSVAAGVYYCLLQASDIGTSRKFVLAE